MSVKFTEKAIKKRFKRATRLPLLTGKKITCEDLRKCANSKLNRILQRQNKKETRNAIGKAYLDDNYCLPNSTELHHVFPKFTISYENITKLDVQIFHKNFADQCLYNRNDISAIRNFFQIGQLKLPDDCPKCNKEICIDSWLPFNKESPKLNRKKEKSKNPVRRTQAYRCPKCLFEIDMTYGSWLHHFRYTSYKALALALFAFMHCIPSHRVIHHIIFGLMKKSRYYELIQFFRSVCYVHFVYRPIQFHRIRGCKCFKTNQKNLHPVIIERIEEQIPFYHPDVHCTNNHLSCTTIRTNIVALDEAYLGKTRKYMAGGFWQKVHLFGISSTIGGFTMIRVIPRLRRIDVIPHILRTVCPGMLIFTDKSNLYFKLNIIGYQHESVNHSIHEFVNRISRCTTNSIEVSQLIFHKMLSGVEKSPYSKEQGTLIASSCDTKEQFTFFYGSMPIFSNFYPSPIVIDGTTFANTEQYFHYMKAYYFQDKLAMQRILEAKTPSEQKKMGRLVKNFNQNEWEKVSKEFMKKGNMAKYTQNTNLRKRLFLSAPTTLVEASPVDCKWGIGLSMENSKAVERYNWRGSNLLGTVLMEVRDELMKLPQYETEI